MRLSSPALAAAFIDGATRAGRRRRRLRDDRDRHAVLRRRARRPRRRRRRSPRRTIPKQYNGMKMVRQEAFPLSGDAASRDIRDMIAGGRAAAAGGRAAARVTHERRARRLRRARDVVHRPVGHQAVQRRARRRQRHGRPGRAEAVRAAALPDDAAVLRDRRHASRTTRPTRSSRRTAATSSSASIAEKADIGIAWDGDADRCFFIDGTGEFISGDFITALLAEAFLLKHPGATIIYDLRASYAVKDIVAQLRRHGADEPRRPRVLQAADARDQRRSSAARSPATTTSATTSTPTTASSRRC